MKEKEVISEETYFNYLSDDYVSEEEQKEIEDFELQMQESMKYQDYLVGDHKKEFDNYKHKISTALEDLEVNDNNLPYTKRQREAIEKYSKMNEMANAYKEQKRQNEYKKVLKKDVKSGYVNAFIVVLSMLFTGILVGFLIYFGM